MGFEELEALELAEAMEFFHGDELLDEEDVVDFDALDGLLEEADLDGFSEEELDAYEGAVDLGGALREVLLEDYADAQPEEMGEALLNIMESLAPAESFSLGKALSQIEKGTAQALSDPTLGQIARTALPVAGGAAGTLIGGPGVGTAIGTGLGTAAAKALPASGKASQSLPATRTVPSAPSLAPPAMATPAAGGSDAALKGLVLSQLPDVQKHLLALALGDLGRKSVGGVPVGAVMNLLSTTFGQAAADADELLQASSETPTYLLDGEGDLQTDPAAPVDRSLALYAALLEAENHRLAETMDLR